MIDQGFIASHLNRLYVMYLIDNCILMPRFALDEALDNLNHKFLFRGTIEVQDIRLFIYQNTENNRCVYFDVSSTPYLARSDRYQQVSATEAYNYIQEE